MLRRWTSRGVKELASAASALAKPPPGIVILLYHRVGRRTHVSVDLPLWLFEEQIARVSEDPGVADLQSALGSLQDALTPEGAPQLVITFDDGTADFVDLALPVIVKYRVPVIVYVATDFIDSGRDFPGDGRPASWSALRDAVSTGLVTIGSHTHTHLLLDRVSADQAARDINMSVDMIGQHLGLHAEHFAYPKAVLGTPAVEGLVAEVFQSAAVAGTRPNPLGSSNRYRLSRTPIQIEDGLRFFDTKVKGGMSLEDDVRRLVNRRRLAGAHQ